MNKLFSLHIYPNMETSNEISPEITSADSQRIHLLKCKNEEILRLLIPLIYFCAEFSWNCFLKKFGEDYGCFNYVFGVISLCLIPLFLVIDVMSYLFRLIVVAYIVIKNKIKIYNINRNTTKSVSTAIKL